MILDIINNNYEAQPTDKVLELLHRDFPQCFNKEGLFDMTAFSELLNDKADLVKEGSGFNFLGKNYASLLASMTPQQFLFLTRNTTASRKTQTAGTFISVATTLTH